MRSSMTVIAAVCYSDGRYTDRNPRAERYEVGMRLAALIALCLAGSALEEARKILASNGKLHRAMRETIGKAWPEADRHQAEGRAAP
jgi:hypothetical protein